MKRFTYAVVLCACLLVGLSTLLFPVTQAAENPLLTLLNLPAPPPPNPQVVQSGALTLDPVYTKKNPPPDDAPIEVLMAYWQAQSAAYNDLRYKVFPSDKVRERLFDEIEKDPKRVAEFLNVLPRDARSGEFVRRIYDSLSSGTEEDRELRSTVKRWLKFNTSYFSSELAREASRVADNDDYVVNHDELIALARVDWDRANPIVSRLYSNMSQPASRAAAIWALYLHAMQSGSPGDTDRYRDELKAIVSDRSLAAGVRDLALDALSLEKEWSGRDEWYLSLMADETLTDLGRFTGLTTLPGNSPEDKYIDRMIELLKSDNIVVRTAAAQNLLDRLDGSSKPEIVNALLPWIENSKWLKETQRSGRELLIRTLAQVKNPDSVPGLIAALDEKHNVPRYVSANTNSVARAVNSAAMAGIAANFAANSANYSVISDYRFGNVYPLRNAAINAIAFQKDPRAIPALRRILGETTQQYEQAEIVKAIYECGGFSLSEQVAAIETVAKMSAEAGVGFDGAANANVVRNMPLAYTVYNSTGNPVIEIPRMLGIHLVNGVVPGEDLARAVVERIAAIERGRDRELALAMRRIVMRWPGAAVNIMLLQDIKKNNVDPDGVLRLLAIRKELREKQGQDVFDLRTGSPIGVGISACILEDPRDLESMLDNENLQTRTALLACARLIRAPLPLQKVATNLHSTDKLLALAAERYLESEDSPAARQIVLSLHPGEAKILGASTAFFADSDNAGGISSDYLMALFATVGTDRPVINYYTAPGRDLELTAVEKRLQDEVKKDTSLLGVYSWRENFIRIYKDRAVVSWEQDPARFRERVLTKEEFDNFKSLLEHYKADELPPFLPCVNERCQTAELLMLGRAGGRRLFVKAETMPEFFAQLDRTFEDMRQPPSVIKYWAGKDLPGLQILFADDRLDAIAVWKSGADFRLLTADKVRRAEIDKELDRFNENLLESDEYQGEDGESAIEKAVSKEKEKREYENYVWSSFADGALTGGSSQPPQFNYIPEKDSLSVPPNEEQWKARAGITEIRADEKGLYKIVAGKLTKLKDGYYDSPVVAPNGRWVIATKYDEELGAQLIRINLLTGRQYVVRSDQIPAYKPVAVVASLDRVLVGPADENEEYYDSEGSAVDNDTSSYGLLDPETGVVSAVRGEIRPLIQQTYRSLQPGPAPFEFWAAIPNTNETVIGLYNTRNLTVKQVLKIPKISFNSMDMWADPVAGKIYFVYEGHLLSAPVDLAKPIVNHE